jgi:hypothetical protein
VRASSHIGAALAPALALWLAACSGGNRGEGEPCASGAECGDGLQCLEGVCAPTCQNHVDCGDGYRCEEGGQCVLVESKVGDVCLREIDCGPGQTCALDDRDRNGDDFLTGTCQLQGPGDPIASPCEEDADCQTGICAIGLCTQLCGQPNDCPPGLTCATVPRLLEDSAPRFTTCLPSRGVVVDEIPVTTPTASLRIPVPSTASSFAIVMQVDDDSQLVGVTRLAAPGGRLLYVLPETADQFYANDIRYQPSFGVSTMLVSNTPDVELAVGAYQAGVGSILELGGSGTEVPRVAVQYKLDRVAGLDLHVHFLDLADHPCAEFFEHGVLDAATAASSAQFQSFLGEIDGILAPAGVRLGAVGYDDISGRGDLDSIGRDRLGDLLALSSEPTGIHVFLVRSMTPVAVQAMVGGQPGPPRTPGTRASGVAISVDTLCYRDWHHLARITAHALVRQMGLYHNRGPDGALDTISDSDDSIENLTFFGDFGGTQLSDGQREVLRRYPGLQ